MKRAAHKEKELRNKLGPGIAVYHLYRDGHPYGTVAVRKVGKYLVDRAYAYCSKAENFAKSTGRLIALQRLAASDTAVVALYAPGGKYPHSPVAAGAPVYEHNVTMCCRERMIFYGNKEIEQ